MKAGIDAARADLFQKGVFGIVAPPGTPGEAVKLAADFSRLVGAEPMFAELGGSRQPDGQPAPAAPARVRCPAGHDRRPAGLAGRTQAGRQAPMPAATGALFYQDTAAGLRDAVLADRENTLRVLDSLTASLNAIREEIAAQDSAQTGCAVRQGDRRARAMVGRARKGKLVRNRARAVRAKRPPPEIICASCSWAN